MPKILVVEDELDLSGAISDWLKEEHHLIETVDNGNLALERLRTRAYDLIILDLLLPGLGGMEVCEKYRASGGCAPIIMLTAKQSLTSKEAGLDIGADDYMTKPFHLRELSARIRALLRRPAAVQESVFVVGDVCLDRNSCQVTKVGVEIHMLPKEFALLELLMRNAGEVLNVNTLIDRVWGVDDNVVPDTVRSYIKTLRKKLDDPGAESIIHTVHGIGYKIKSANV